MPRAPIGVLVWVVAFTALSAQPPVFTSRVDLVHLGITVEDDEGQLVGDLTPGDLDVYEDGEPQTIEYFSRGLASDPAVMPIHLGLMLDASASMSSDARFVKTAAIRFLNMMTYAEDITLVDFDTEVRVGRYGQPDVPRLIQRIRAREAEGMTALYDALGVYLDGAFEQTGRKVLLLYSDGEDTRSRLRFADAVDLVRASDVTVYVIGLQQHLRNPIRMRQRLRLEELAEVTGGRGFFPSKVDELAAIYEEIATELATRYVLGYTSSNPGADGTWRRVDITVRDDRRADLRGAVVRARQGYFAPYVESEEQPE